ncbi:hypothetical protein HYS91_02095 [Candidatus Daviesbacteria bacterium]|nr:hypothetical protein [Candidatus Daviesbacteria bacterium]
MTKARVEPRMAAHLAKLDKYRQAQLSKDDQRSNESSKRKLAALHGAASEIERFLNSTGEYLRNVTSRTRRMLSEGLGGEPQYFGYAEDTFPISLKPEATRLLKKAMQIMDEKGFRFGPALLTPREHKEIGSSGYGGIFWDYDPDMPVPLIQTILVAEGKKDVPDSAEVYTQDEIDRARRLTGETALDPQTGRVTKLVDSEAANDSYYFLSPQRREEIMREEEDLLTSLEQLANTGFRRHHKVATLLADLEAVAEGQITTPGLKRRFRSVLKEVPSRHPISLEGYVRDLRKIAFETGKWDLILTPQEVLLRAGGRVDLLYLTRPYTPLAIQDGTPIADIAKIRKGERSMVVNTDLMDYEMPFGFRLERLDAKGNTVRSPTFLNHNDGVTPLTDRIKEFYAGQVNVPFARPEDWHYEGRDDKKTHPLEKLAQSILNYTLRVS